MVKPNVMSYPFYSHELRTPLNILQMGVVLLQNKIEEFPSEGLPKILGIVSELKFSSRRSLNVLEDLLAYEAIASSSLTIECSDLPLAPLLQEVGQQFMLSARAGNIDFKVLTPSDYSSRFLVSVDKSRMAQAIGNLIYNAITSSPEETTVSVVAVPLWNGDEDTESSETIVGVRIKVIDSGEPISNAALAAVFSEARFNNDAGVGGGLGLFISKGIVEVHGGRVGVFANTSGVGSTFYIDLPTVCEEAEHQTVFRRRSMSEIPKFKTVNEKPSAIMHNTNRRKVFVAHVMERDSEYSPMPENDDVEAQNALAMRDLLLKSASIFGMVVPGMRQDLSSNRSKHSANSRSKRIQPLSDVRSESPVRQPKRKALDMLVVDDSALNRKMMVRLMSSIGHRCTEANDGSTAVDTYRGRQALGGPNFDVILMDNSMPIMNGTAAAKSIRELGFKGPLLGVTGNSHPEDIKEFEHCGADLVIIKPLDVEKFDAALKILLVGKS